MNGRQTPIALVAMTVTSLAALCFPGAAEADIYKCTNAKGRVEFMDAPCAPGSTGKVVDVQPNIIDASGQRKAIAREQAANVQRATSAPMTGGPASMTSSAEPRKAATVDPAACAAAESDYQSASSTAGTSNSDLNAKASAAYAACGTSPPRHVIGARTNLQTSQGTSSGTR
jgi:hypothetical protein